MCQMAWEKPQKLVKTRYTVLSMLETPKLVLKTEREIDNEGKVHNLSEDKIYKKI